MKFIKKYYILFCLISIFILAVFLRFYQLSDIPSGLTNDEADIGYDAYSLAKTGHDQWNQFLPISGFIGFGDYRLPLYTYLVVPSVIAFDLSTFAVRFPSALFGAISTLLMYFFASKIFGKKIGLLSAFLFAVSPWSIGLSRIG